MKVLFVGVLVDLQKFKIEIMIYRNSATTTLLLSQFDSREVDLVVETFA